MVWSENRPRFSVPPESAYIGHNVVVTGKVTRYQGVPQIEVSSPDQIQICPTMTPSTTTTPPITTTSSVKTTGANHDGGTFQTPSRNIGCYMVATYLNCEIYEASWQPPDRSDCPTSAGRFVTMAADGTVRVQCGTPDAANDGYVLPYGDTSSRGPFSCSSASDGLTCEGQGHGFFLSRERVTTH